jgi:hypothetical protein
LVDPHADGLENLVGYRPASGADAHVPIQGCKEFPI